ncbi:MAG TPA: L-seryl-tRNA(Sec) selenium transferase [Acidimicrobiia bacterium]
MPPSRPPSVDRLARELDPLGLPRALVVDTARRVTDLARHDDIDADEVEAMVLAEVASLERLRPQRVINATGVLLHTNLGRAPLAQAAAEEARLTATNYTNVELDLADGDRGGRNRYLERLIELTTGADAAIVVNNNAAALVLVLATLARRRKVAISRGELIEIGGSYRLPELFKASGVKLLEVGTTNRTRLDDYRSAIDHGAAMVLKVHPSNYRISGFTQSVEIPALARLADASSVPLVFDAGSGLLDEGAGWLGRSTPLWLAGEPGVRQALKAGADLVLFSGDKLLGGPQAGVVAGSRNLIERLRRNPLARAVRIEPTAAAALTATLSMYAAGTAAQLPFWRMATLAAAEVQERARAVVAAAGVEAAVVEGPSLVGAGAAPGAEIPSFHIRLPGAESAFPALLGWRPPVVARRDAGKLVIDLRTVEPTDDQTVASALAKTWRS